MKPCNHALLDGSIISSLLDGYAKCGRIKRKICWLIEYKTKHVEYLKIYHGAINKIKLIESNSTNMGIQTMNKKNIIIEVLACWAR